MFIGHFAVAFGIKRAAPEVKLGTAIVAACFLDLVWPLLVAAGVETVKIDPGNMVLSPLDFVSYPYSHSLLMTLVWAGLFAGVYRWRGGSARAALWLGVAVASHWFLDLVVHRPDLPLAPGLDMRIGLGLWNSVAGTLAVEGSLFAAGLWLYLSTTRARDRIGRWGPRGLAVLLLVSYVAAMFGPPPPNVDAIVIADILGTALSVACAYWVDRHRDVVPRYPASSSFSREARLP
ncbi:MAG TPA: hypothetical protein VEI74_03875 [Candidatus Methylomirabilis sp.]|nr:hypothetical protein [Candidatus Methylomirabilis sp.]